MAKSIVGLDIGASGIRAVEVAPGRKGVRLLRSHAVALPQGAVERGEVVEPLVVTSALRSLWKQGRFRSRDVVLGIGNDRSLARDLTVPNAPLSIIRETLPFHVQDLLPVPVSDAVLDFYPVAEAEHGHVQGLLVAAVKDGVLATIEAVRRARLEPTTVDFIPFALTRAFAPAAAAHASTVAVVDVGAHTTSVVVTAGGVPRFVRIIPAGGDSVTQMLHARFGLDRGAAESAKRALGLGADGVDPAREEMVEAIRAETGELVTGVRNTIAYFAGAHPSLPVQRTLITGEGATLQGFPAALAEVLRMPVSWADPYAALSPKDRERDALGGNRAAVALGLAMRSAA